MEPFRTMSFSGNYYALAIVDDYYHYTWTLFISHINNVCGGFRKLDKVILKEKGLKIACIQSYQGGMFQNEEFETFVIKIE